MEKVTTRKRPGSKRFSLDQEEVLVKAYQQNPELSGQRMVELSVQLDLTQHQIKTWFSDRNREEAQISARRAAFRNEPFVVEKRNAELSVQRNLPVYQTLFLAPNEEERRTVADRGDDCRPMSTSHLEVEVAKTNEDASWSIPTRPLPPMPPVFEDQWLQQQEGNEMMNYFHTYDVGSTSNEPPECSIAQMQGYVYQHNWLPEYFHETNRPTNQLEPNIVDPGNLRDPQVGGNEEVQPQPSYQDTKSRQHFNESAAIKSPILSSAETKLGLLPNLPPNPNLDDDRVRFQVELEFVQCLANPHYLNVLAQKGFFKEPNFVNYLKYLLYWKKPEYVKHIKYPHCMSMLELLQYEQFRVELVNSPSVKFIENQLLLHWRYYIRKREHLFS
ncbi:uncharacterized protein LOC143459988 [Clavelina lepadiformis]|uniref:uncharacterized protein LOC143459988 n=1 Tax=Clavelina lepadiformis TaxID=159417 RepID=UPI004042D5D3